MGDAETRNSEPAGALIAEAESWIGTPWIHGQAVKGAGTDCVQFLVKLGKLAGAIPAAYEPPRYNRDWALHNSRSILREEIGKFCDEVAAGSLAAGDIVLTNHGHCASHAALYAGNGLVIESRIRGGVSRSPLPKLGPVDSVWRFRAGGPP